MCFNFVCDLYAFVSVPVRVYALCVLEQVDATTIIICRFADIFRDIRAIFISNYINGIDGIETTTRLKLK